ncbi:MAG: putative hydrophobic protein (TIGR00271 family) [Paraglaciecola sp.]|jgi:uncharacterized hydrophobic protein (TIGR00271 family)
MAEDKKPFRATPEEKSKEKIRTGYGELTNGLSDFFRNLADLRPGLDRAGTIIRIRDNREMKGANAWLLMCSIVVASLGLDLNSPAVIIGAMLISPLMSPILGIGLSFGIEDRVMLRNSFFHLMIAIGIALVTSFIYFKLTPFGAKTPEIDARTAPTLLDVMVAFFGGIAGIVSGSRKDQSNAIPGVAIATALMPPLCVTGYGLANGDWEAVGYSFYLFFINATFVALATYLIVRLLKFPQKQFKDEKEKRKTHRWMLILSILLIVPSIYTMWTVYKKVQDKQQIQVSMNDIFGEGNWEWEQNNISSKNKKLKVRAYLADDIIPHSIINKRNRFYLRTDSLADLRCVRTNLSQEKIDEAKLGNSIEKRILENLQEDIQDISEKDREIISLNEQLDSLSSDKTFFRNITAEAQTLFPKLTEIGFARVQQTNFDTLIMEMPTFIVHWEETKPQKEKDEDRKKLKSWIMYRAKLDSLQILEK